MSAVTLIGWYELPSVLTLTPKCFGESIHVKIAGRSGELLLPEVVWNGEEPQVVAPTLPAKAVQYVEHHGGLRRAGWGKVSQWNPAAKVVLKAHVSAVALRFPAARADVSYSEYSEGRGRPQGELVDSLFASIDDWFEGLRTWVEVKSDQDLDSDHPLREVRVPGRSLGVVADESGQLSLPATASRITINARDDEPLTLPLLRRAVQLANEAAMFDDAHLLLRDSRAAVRRGQYRRAAIDAGSALELTLADFNRTVTKLSLHRPGRPPTLGTYVKKIGAQAGLPANVKQDVVQLRNDAIHNNKTPTRAESDLAVALVSSVVNRLRPLPL
ncbi:hypothetical protein [Geodermatophilus sp. URMC 65]